MDKKRRAILYVIVWMAVIFIMSQMPSDESSEHSGRAVRLVLAGIRLFFGESAARAAAAGNIEFIVRKLAHFSEYTILCLLTGRAMRLYGVRYRQILCVLFCALYAAGDEFHQFFIPGRAMALTDVGIDTLGACFGLLLDWALLARIRKRTGWA